MIKELITISDVESNMEKEFEKIADVENIIDYQIDKKQNKDFTSTSNTH